MIGSLFSQVIAARAAGVKPRISTVGQAISAATGVAATGTGTRTTAPAPIPPPPPRTEAQAAAGVAAMQTARQALQQAAGQPSGGIVANLPADLAARMQPPASAVTEETLQAARDEVADQMQAVGQAEPVAVPKPGIGGPLAGAAAGFLVAGPLGAAVGAGALWWLGRKK